MATCEFISKTRLISTNKQENLRSTQTPTQLITLDLLGDLDLAINRHLVPSVQQRQHKVQIKTSLGPLEQLLHRALDTLEYIPSFVLRLRTLADARRQVLELRQLERLGHAQRRGAVVEIAEEVDVLAGKRLGKAGLVHAVEGAWRDRAFFLLEKCLLG